MNVLKTIVVAVATSAFVSTAAHAAVTFDFTAGGNTGPGFFEPSPFPTTPFVIDGVGIQVSGGEYVGGDTIVDFSNRVVNKSADGLGVGGFLSDREIDGDNFGDDDLLTVFFDQVVIFDEAFFSLIDPQDQVDVFIDGVLVAALEDFGLSPSSTVDLDDRTGQSISFGAERGGALFNPGREDDFRLASISVTPVPLPGALPLLGLGVVALLGAGAMRRRTDQD